MSDKKLSQTRQQLLDIVLEKMKGDYLTWTAGWGDGGSSVCPVSVVTGKPYEGLNRTLLFLIARKRGYEDNRWITFKQMEKMGLSFKKDENGASLAKGHGVSIEFFRYYDKKTKKDIDWIEFEKLPSEERRQYWLDNIRPVPKTYTVFNASLVEGMPPRAAQVKRTPVERDARAEQVIRAWNDKQCPVLHDGGDKAYYSPQKDEVHLPAVEAFHSATDYYGTALHEIGHATGHESRLARKLGAGFFGSEKYAIEELRAEFASLFLQDDLELPVSEFHMNNHAAYLQHWAQVISDKPDILFDAITDAEKISSFVLNNAAIAVTEQSRTAAVPAALAQQVLEAPDEPARFGTTVRSAASDNVNE